MALLAAEEGVKKQKRWIACDDFSNVSSHFQVFLQGVNLTTEITKLLKHVLCMLHFFYVVSMLFDARTTHQTAQTIRPPGQNGQDLPSAEEAFTGVIRRTVGLLSKDMGLLQRVPGEDCGKRGL